MAIPPESRTWQMSLPGGGEGRCSRVVVPSLRFTPAFQDVRVAVHQPQIPPAPKIMNVEITTPNRIQKRPFPTLLLGYISNLNLSIPCWHGMLFPMLIFPPPRATQPARSPHSERHRTGGSGTCLAVRLAWGTFVVAAPFVTRLPLV